MTSDLSPLAHLRARFLSGEATPKIIAAESLARANSNASRNVYLALDPARVIAEAAALAQSAPGNRPLYGVPISLKDCFDLDGYPTTCGSLFYAAQNGTAATDSAVAAVLRTQGAIVTGKTHLHQLAYGITGENADYGDCAQPGHPALLTGGSSSGAAASILEGSALAAIGTDTGGSIRVPAALCGLAGYRSSHGTKLRTPHPISAEPDPWQGTAHLAPSFDTLGWLFRDLRDAPTLARSLFAIEPLTDAPRSTPIRIAVVSQTFLHDAEPAVLEAFAIWQQRLSHAGAQLQTIPSPVTNFWSNAFEIFAPIQAHEASLIHHGNFAHFQPDIAERLAWGASISPATVAQLHADLKKFRSDMNSLMAEYDYLILPCAPVSALRVGEDHTDARRRILRYTTPMSLAGNPVIALPGNGGGVQLVGRPGNDAPLLAFAEQLGEQLGEQLAAGN